MSEAVDIYDDVCEAADTWATVKALTPHRFQQLWSHLLGRYSENGISGQVLGMLMVEGARRYAQQSSPATQKCGVRNAERGMEEGETRKAEGGTWIGRGRDL